MAITKNSQIDLNGNEMILDADADTKIDAATDDEIHFTVAGSETVYMGVTSYNASDRIVLSNTGGNASATIVGSTSGESSVFMADGTSGDASYRGYVQYQHTNDNMNFGAAGSEAMRIDSSGNVGIGATSSLQKLSVTSASGTVAEFLGESGPHGLRVYGNDGGFGAIGHVSSGSYDLSINSSGNVLLGDGANLAITYTTDNKLIMHHGHDFGNIGISLSCGAYTSNYDIMRFYNGNGQVGDVKLSGSATQFNTSSDYRLKENVSYDWDATSRLKQLKPARFNFKVDKDTTLDGFLAHEVSDIVPNAINGEKDAVYTAKDEVNGLGKEGEPNMQSIDHSKLVPLLVKTIQELEARITTLEGG